MVHGQFVNSLKNRQILHYLSLPNAQSCKSRLFKFCRLIFSFFFMIVWNFQTHCFGLSHFAPLGLHLICFTPLEFTLCARVCVTLLPRIFCALISKSQLLVPSDFAFTSRSLCFHKKTGLSQSTQNRPKRLEMQIV